MKKIINIKNNKKTLIVVIAILLCAPAAVVAVNIVTEGYRVGTAATTIDAHGVCNSVVSTNGQEYFVPTNSAAEWSAFRANKPSTVSLGACTTPVPPGTFDCTCASGSQVCATRSRFNRTDIYNRTEIPVKSSCTVGGVYISSTSHPSVSHPQVVGNNMANSGTTEFASGLIPVTDLISPVVYIYPINSAAEYATPFTVGQDTNIPCARSGNVIATLKVIGKTTITITGGSQNGALIEASTNFGCY